MNPVNADLVAENVAALRLRIEAHASRPVRLVAVTKRFGIDAIEAAIAAGLQDIGESYAQELVAKRTELADRAVDAELRWHFIGHLQRNKVRPLGDLVDVWQSVDSFRLGQEIAKRAPGAEVLVQVNLAGNADQGGVPGDEVEALVTDLDGIGLDVSGLMMIGSAGDADTTRALFADLRARADALGLPECSMGMSGDLELALEAGATMVRIGTAIFGPRPQIPADGANDLD
jgi:PLP dependent protein